MFVLLSWEPVDPIFSSSSRDSHMTLGWDNPTTVPTTTILLRHGDTRLSPEHRFSGQRDLPLSASGTRQAKAPPSAWPPGPRSTAGAGSPRRRPANPPPFPPASLA